MLHIGRGHFGKRLADQSAVGQQNFEQLDFMFGRRRLAVLRFRCGLGRAGNRAGSALA